MMDCEQVRHWLERDLDGAAEPSGDVAAHLDRCRACAAEAGRTKAIAEAARAALPPADVPVDFTEQVLDEVMEPAGDQRLAAAARPRLRRWLPLVAVAALLPLAFLLRPAPKIRGDLRVERDGEWVAAKTADPGETFGLEAGGAAERGEIRITAQEVTLLQEDEGTVMLLAGDVTLESTELTVADTPLGEIRLQADSVCVATLKYEGEVEMQFVDLKKAVPAVLAVTVLAGGATVVNAQGMQPAGPGERVIVEGSNPPRLDPEAVQREIDRLRRELVDARVQIAALQGPKAPRTPNARRQINELNQASNANKSALMRLARDMADLRMEKDTPEKRARLAELEEAYRKRVAVAKAYDEKLQVLEKRLTAEEILKESRDLTRLAEELQEEIEEDEVSDEPFHTDYSAMKARVMQAELARLENALAEAKRTYAAAHPEIQKLNAKVEHHRVALGLYLAALAAVKDSELKIDSIDEIRVVRNGRVWILDAEGNLLRSTADPDPLKEMIRFTDDVNGEAMRAEIARVLGELTKARMEYVEDSDLVQQLRAKLENKRLALRRYIETKSAARAGDHLEYVEVRHGPTEKSGGPATDAEKAALKAEIARLKEELADRERAEQLRYPDLKLVKTGDLVKIRDDDGIGLMKSRLAFQRQRLADLDREIVVHPEDAQLALRRVQLMKSIHELDLQLAARKLQQTRDEHNDLAGSIRQLESEIDDLKRGNPGRRTKERIKQLEDVLETTKREFNRGQLAGRVLAAKEGIVVLSLGSKDGVTPGWHFNVHRGNQWIARVVVTEAKENQSVARLDLKRAESELTPQKGDFVRRAH